MRIVIEFWLSYIALLLTNGAMQMTMKEQAIAVDTARDALASAAFGKNADSKIKSVFIILDKLYEDLEKQMSDAWR